MTKRFALAALIAPALLASGAARAQIAPGFKVPESMAEAVDDAQSWACFLATAGNPVPGVNQPLLGMEGEGLKIEPAAPDWLTSARPAVPGVRYSTLETPDGPIWIVFDGARHSCLIVARSADTAALHQAVVTRLDGDKDWKPNKAGTSDGVRSWFKRIDGSPLRWETRIWETADPQPVLLIETLATGR